MLAPRLLSVVASALLLLWSLAGTGGPARAQSRLDGLDGLDGLDASAGRRLAERVEAELRGRAAMLRWADLEHYALIAEMEPGDLARLMARVSVRRDGDAFVLGAGTTVEFHGGGILDLLFAHWKPEGRTARAADRFPFQEGEIALGAIYAGHRRQIFLPNPDVSRPDGSRDARRGAIPDAPQLPRMRFFAEVVGLESVERDAYSFLRLLVVHEADGAASWVNHVGQELNADLLLEQAWQRYLSETAAEAEIEDHSYLHLVEILLSYQLSHQRRSAADAGPGAALDPNAIKRRFLAVELARPTRETDDERLAHYVESLGWLMAYPGVRWAPQEQARVRAWLLELEEVRFVDLADVEGSYLAHLARGLRMLGTHRARIEGG